MILRYRYLGSGGIFIGDKHYHNNDIVEIDKPLVELGLNPLMFAELFGKSERDKVTERIKILEDEKKLLEVERQRKIKELEKEYEGRIKAKNDEQAGLQKIYKEEFEPKMPKPEKSKGGK